MPNNFQNNIKKELDKIRKYLKSHGGDVEFVSADEKSGIVEVRLVGMCAHCPMSAITLKEGIEVKLIKKIKSIKEVVAV